MSETAASSPRFQSGGGRQSASWSLLRAFRRDAPRDARWSWDYIVRTRSVADQEALTVYHGPRDLEHWLRNQFDDLAHPRQPKRIDHWRDEPGHVADLIHDASLLHLRLQSGFNALLSVDTTPWAVITYLTPALLVCLVVVAASLVLSVVRADASMSDAFIGPVNPATLVMPPSVKDESPGRFNAVRVGDLYGDSQHADSVPYLRDSLRVEKAQEYFNAPRIGRINDHIVVVATGFVGSNRPIDRVAREHVVARADGDIDGGQLADIGDGYAEDVMARVRLGEPILIKRNKYDPRPEGQRVRFSAERETLFHSAPLAMRDGDIAASDGYQRRSERGHYPVARALIVPIPYVGSHDVEDREPPDGQSGSDKRPGDPFKRTIVALIVGGVSLYIGLRALARAFAQ